MSRRDERWRVTSCDDGRLDEVVVAKWLHVERMDNGRFFVAVGPRRFMVSVAANGTAKLVREER